MSSRRSRVGGGNTYRSSAPPSARPEFAPPSLAPPRQPRTGRRATSRESETTPVCANYPVLSQRSQSSISLYQGSARSAAPSQLLSQRDPMHSVQSSSRRRQNNELPSSRRQSQQLEDAVDVEIGHIFRQVDMDVGFNKADEQESAEAQRIIQDGAAEERGFIPLVRRVRDVDADSNGVIDEDEVFVNQVSKLARASSTPADPVEDGTWRQNFNPHLKWWQGTPLGDMSRDEEKIRGLVDLNPSHPAYFAVRRKAPSLGYIKEPTFKTRTELMDMRKKCALPNSSYDLDGDGVVGVREFFMAAMLDKDCSGSLSLQEKQEGLLEMRKNLANVMFVDNAGKAGDRDANNQYRVIQQDGAIVLDAQ